MNNIGFPPFLLMILVALLPATGCYDTGTQPEPFTCLKIGDADLTEWNGCDNGSLTVLFFPIESAVDMPYAFSWGGQPIDIYAPDGLLESILACFTEWEELALQAFNWLTSDGNISKMQLGTVPPDQTYRDTLVPKLFFLDETGSYLTIKNPFTGADIIIRNVDYIKFKGSPLLPVPPL